MKTKSLLFVSTISVLCLVLYFFTQTIRYNGLYEYHRSKMFEFQHLALIKLNIPIGTDVDTVLKKLSLPQAAYQKKGNEGLIDIFPELPIIPKEYKDYSGFYLYFKNNELIWIEPVGPDYATNEIRLEYLQKHFKFPLWNRP